MHGIRRYLMSTLMFIALAACSQEGSPPQETAENVLGEPPIGTWVQFGRLKAGVLDSETLDREETTLILSDSTYILTFKRPDIDFTFVERGKVKYNLRGKTAAFTVASTAGVDWSSGTPRKVSLIPDAVPFQRDPGMRYQMEYNVQDSLMSLTAPDTEDSWFARAPE